MLKEIDSNSGRAIQKLTQSEPEEQEKDIEPLILTE